MDITKISDDHLLELEEETRLLLHDIHVECGRRDGKTKFWWRLKKNV